MGRKTQVMPVLNALFVISAKKFCFPEAGKRNGTVDEDDRDV